MTEVFDELNGQDRVHNLLHKYLGKKSNRPIQKENLATLEEAISNQYSETQEQYINWLANHDETQKALIQDMLNAESVFNNMKEILNVEKNKIFYNLSNQNETLTKKFKYGMKYMVENKTLDESLLEATYKQFQDEVAKIYTEYYLKQLDHLKNKLKQPIENFQFNIKDSQQKISAENFFKYETILPQSAAILSGMDELFSNTVGWGELIADTALSIIEGALGTNNSTQERKQRKLLDQLNPKIEDYMKELKKYLHLNFKDTVTSIEQAVLELQLKQIEKISEKHSLLIDDIQNNANMYENQLKLLRNDLEYIQSLEIKMGMNLFSNIKKLQLLDEEINSLNKLNLQKVLELLDMKTKRENA